MIHEAQGNLLRDDADALVNTVNTVGVMGKGIALQFKRAYPEMFKDYARAAKAGRLEPGRMHVWETGSLTGPRFIINFPTKRHWKAQSRVEDIDAGLSDLVRVVQELRIRSIAVPPLGCGNGGLDWALIAPRITEAFAALASSVDVRVYPPAGAPAPSDMVDRSAAPSLTPVRAALLRLMSAYREAAWEWPGLIETQKLAYFLQEAGEPLRLDFVQAPYGPYAENLRKTLRDMEGHYITGYGDGSIPPLEVPPLQVTEDAQRSLRQSIETSPTTEERMRRVLELVGGFEGTYDLELLASVHWAVTQAGATSPEEASEFIRGWTRRKRELFGADHVEVAWRALADGGWLNLPEAA